MAPVPPPLDFPAWLDNGGREKLVPPVMNDFLYGKAGSEDGSDLVVMVVGGPNERNDVRPRASLSCRCSQYHINSTSEYFYQTQGRLLLRIVDEGQFRDVWVEEGWSV